MLFRGNHIILDRRLEEMSADEQKRWEYEMRQKAIRDQRHMLASGRREGERKKAVEMAREMLKDKMPIEKVAKYAGLSVEDIQKLVK